jgi:hypothetical protein
MPARKSKAQTGGNPNDKICTKVLFSLVSAGVKIAGINTF